MDAGSGLTDTFGVASLGGLYHAWHDYLMMPAMALMALGTADTLLGGLGSFFLGPLTMGFEHLPGAIDSITGAFSDVAGSVGASAALEPLVMPENHMH